MALLYSKEMETPVMCSAVGSESRECTVISSPSSPSSSSSTFVRDALQSMSLLSSWMEDKTTTTENATEQCSHSTPSNTAAGVFMACHHRNKNEEEEEEEEEDLRTHYSYFHSRSSPDLTGAQDAAILHSENECLPPAMQILSSPLRRLPSAMPDVPTTTSFLSAGFYVDDTVIGGNGGCRDSGLSCAFSSSTSLASNDTVLIMPSPSNCNTSAAPPPVPPHAHPHLHPHSLCNPAPVTRASASQGHSPISPKRGMSANRREVSSSYLPQPALIRASPLDSGVEDISPGEGGSGSGAVSKRAPPALPCHCRRLTEHAPPHHNHHHHPTELIRSNSASDQHRSRIRHSPPPVAEAFQTQNCGASHHRLPCSCCPPDSGHLRPPAYPAASNFPPRQVYLRSSTQAHNLQSYSASPPPANFFQSPVWKRKAPDKVNPLEVSVSGEKCTSGVNCPTSCPNSTGGASVLSPEARLRQEKCTRKRLYRIGLNLLNMKPSQGMRFLVRHNFLPDTPKEIAFFLHTRKGISRQKLGEYLGDKRNQLVLEAYCLFLDFRGLAIEEALRKLNQQFFLTGESDCILRMTEHFAKAYWQQNASWIRDHAGMENCDSVLLLSYAILMLNTDLNSGKLKPASRMKLKDFCKNLKGLNNGHDFDSKLLQTIYQRIQERPFVVREDHVTQVAQIAASLLPEGVLTSPPHRRLVCLCKMQECILLEHPSGVSPGTTVSSFLHVQHQLRYVFLFNDMIVVACRSPPTSSMSPHSLTPPGSQIPSSDNTSRANPPSGGSVQLLSCVSASSSTVQRSKSFQAVTSNDAVPQGQRSYHVLHSVSLVGLRAHLLFRSEQLFAVQLRHAASNATLFMLRAMSASDFAHFLDDLRECILECNEMDAVLRSNNSENNIVTASNANNTSNVATS